MVTPVGQITPKTKPKPNNKNKIKEKLKITLMPGSVHRIPTNQPTNQWANFCPFKHLSFSSLIPGTTNEPEYYRQKKIMEYNWISTVMYS